MGEVSNLVWLRQRRRDHTDDDDERCRRREQRTPTNIVTTQYAQPRRQEKNSIFITEGTFLTQESGSRLPIRRRRPFDNICVFQRSRSVKFGLSAHIGCVLRLGLFSYAGPTSSPSSPFLFCLYPYSSAFTPRSPHGSMLFAGRGLLRWSVFRSAPYFRSLVQH